MHWQVFVENNLSNLNTLNPVFTINHIAMGNLCMHILDQNFVEMMEWSQVELEDWYMDDATIGEGRTETGVFTKIQIDRMGERMSVCNCC